MLILNGFPVSAIDLNGSRAFAIGKFDADAGSLCQSSSAASIWPV